MGFIPSAHTENIEVVAYLTLTGRERMLSKDLSDKKITTFMLGDSDSNYNVITMLDDGDVPDLTGDGLGCVKSISNMDIKHKIKAPTLIIGVPPAPPGGEEEGEHEGGGGETEEEGP